MFPYLAHFFLSSLFPQVPNPSPFFLVLSKFNLRRTHLSNNLPRSRWRGSTWILSSSRCPYTRTGHPALFSFSIFRFFKRLRFLLTTPQSLRPSSSAFLLSFPREAAPLTFLGIVPPLNLNFAWSDLATPRFPFCKSTPPPRSTFLTQQKG